MARKRRKNSKSIRTTLPTPTAVKLLDVPPKKEPALVAAPVKKPKRQTVLSQTLHYVAMARCDELTGVFKELVARLKALGVEQTPDARVRIPRRIGAQRNVNVAAIVMRIQNTTWDRVGELQTLHAAITQKFRLARYKVR
jgi:hypothetical protein